MDPNCAFHLWKESSQFVHKVAVTNTPPVITVRDKFNFKSETPSGEILHNSFQILLTRYEIEGFFTGTNALLLVGVIPAKSNPLQVISVNVNFVHPGRTSDDFPCEVDETRCLDRLPSNIWWSDIRGSDALRFLNGLVEVIIQITVNTDNLNPFSTLSQQLNPTPKTVGPSLNACEEVLDILIEADGEEFTTHRAILAASSPVFDKMFYHDTKESLDNRIRIEGVTSGQIFNLLQYVYTRRCDYFRSGNMDDLMDLYIVGDRYLMDDLKNDCIKLLTDKLTENNVISILNFGKFYDVNVIKNAVMRFCWKNRALIQQSGSSVKSVLKTCYPQHLCTSQKRCAFCDNAN